MFGALITFFGVAFLYWGTRVRDHDFELRIATLNQDAAVARLETEKLKAGVAWRTISADKALALERALAAKPGSVNLRYTDGDPEALFLAIQLSQIFRKANWQIAPGSLKQGNAIIFGLVLPDAAGADAISLREAFTVAQITFSPGPMPNTGTSTSFNVTTIPNAPMLMVGSRPPPQLP